MGPTLANPQQVNRILDRAPDRDEPTFVFLIGAGGSGKSTLAGAFQQAVSHDDLEVAKFDDSTRWGMDRWENHVDEFDSVESCQSAFVKDWISRVRERSANSKLVVCDLNAAPAHIIDACVELNVSSYQCVLVQPTHEVRCERLANDQTRQQMPLEALRGQMDDTFPKFLEAEAQRLEIPHVLNEEREKTLNELSEVCIDLLRT